MPQVPSVKAEALKPILYYMGVTLTPSAGASYSPLPIIAYTMLGLGVIGALVFVGAYIYLLIRHPDRLQTEAYMRDALLGDNISGRAALQFGETPVANTAPLVIAEGAENAG